MDIQDAEHEETNPTASSLLISLLSCSLVGQRQPVKITPGSLTHQAYKQAEVSEEFHCNYGLNPAFRRQMEGGALKVTGVGPDDDVRIVELPSHCFFLATLFLPQLSSKPSRPHPLIMAYVQAARA